MALRLYNTRTRKKQVFRRLDADKPVRMYVCGPTVYDYAHIGNARPVIVFDVLFRLLRHIYGPENVVYVRNITDVDDKINARAAQEGVPIRALTERTAKQFHEDVAALGCLTPTFEPRATEHIPEMIAMIERLIEKGCAYEAEGHVLFHVPSMPAYGALARRSLDEMQAGARVEVAPYKRDPMDFVLWKPSEAGQEPGWDSPWGYGRPGWHLECSAMSAKYLGETFDIHAGGIDLVFPHHENEVAQSCCAHDTPIMANFWLHNGFLQVEGEKMSKSLGNFVTINDLLSTDKFGGRPWPGAALRLAMLKAHYRQPINWTTQALSEAYEELSDWADACFADDASRQLELTQKTQASPVPSEVIEALEDDLNTPQALASIRSLFRNAKRDDGAKPTFLSACRFLGLLRPERLGPHAARDHLSGSAPLSLIAQYREELVWARTASANDDQQMLNRLNHRIRESGVEFRIGPDGLVSLDAIEDVSGSTGQDPIEALINARNAARKAKNWAEADRIRDELAAMGISLKDSKDSETGEITTTWEIAR